MTTFPVLSRYELVKAFAEEYPELKMRDDDFTNPQVMWISHYIFVHKTMLYIIVETV